jgi:SAM-dependent methyltransferase
MTAAGMTERGRAMSAATADFSSATADEDSSEGLFNKQWSIYRKFVDYDLMQHREVYDLLHRLLLEEAPDPFRFLDVACGDASASVGALLDTQIANYHGIDLSAPALDLAHEQVARLPCPANLEQGDFADALRRRNEAADVIWIGQSLHHLDGPAKLAVMHDIRRLLPDRGLFLIWEPARFDDESREAWLDRFEDRWQARQSALTAEEWSAMVDHVRAADFPETLSGWLGMGREAGFGESAELLQAPFDLARVFRFRA